MEDVVKYLILDINKMVGDKVLFLGARPNYKYVEGIKGEQIGIVATCLFEKMGYEKGDIKLNGMMELPFPFDGKSMYVEFDGLEGKVWQDWKSKEKKGEVKLSLSATNIRPTSNERKIKIGAN